MKSTIESGSRPVTGVVFSDLHLGAPYSDGVMAKSVLDESLKDTNFCVLLGDIYEGINLPLKHLVRDSDNKVRSIDGKIKEQEEEIRGFQKSLVKEPSDVRKDVLSERIAEAQHKMRKLGSRKSLAVEVQDRAFSIEIGEHLAHLEQLVLEHPDCKFHYVIGNHERQKEMIHLFRNLAEDINKRFKEDPELAGKKGGLEITEHYVRIGDGLFVHGDQQTNSKNYNLGKDTKFIEPEKELRRSVFMQLLHDFFNKRIPKFVGQELFKAEQNASKILRWFDAQEDPEEKNVALEQIISRNTAIGIRGNVDSGTSTDDRPEALKGITHIFSGHTHFPYTNTHIVDCVQKDFSRYIIATAQPMKEEQAKELGVVGYHNYQFHNTGASLQKVGNVNKTIFNPLRITLETANDAPTLYNKLHSDPDYRNYRIGNVQEIMTAPMRDAYQR